MVRRIRLADDSANLCRKDHLLEVLWVYSSSRSQLGCQKRREAKQARRVMRGDVRRCKAVGFWQILNYSSSNCSRDQLEFNLRRPNDVNPRLGAAVPRD